jgi:hypothetical protein
MRNKVAGLIFIVILIGTLSYFWTHRTTNQTNTNTVPPQQTTNPQPQPTPAPTPTPAKIETPLPPTTGWTFTHRGSGYEWFVPNLVVGEPTAWFTMTDLNTTYRVKNTCIVELKAKAGGSITEFLVNTSTDTRHLVINGNSQVNPWPEAEFQKAAMAAQAIRFKPFNGGNLEVKMGRTE